MMRPLLLATVLAVLCACATVEVKPIYITVDVNIKIDKALEDFFSQQKKAPAAAAETPAAAAETPAAAAETPAPVSAPAASAPAQP